MSDSINERDVRRLTEQLREVSFDDTIKQAYKMGFKQALALLEKPGEPDVCEWVESIYDKGLHFPSCNPMVISIDIMKKHSDIKFCHYCGKPIKVKE